LNVCTVLITCNTLKDYVAAHEQAESSLDFYKEIEMSDCKVITMNEERFEAPEVMFQPSLIGLEDFSVNELLEDRLG
jgi:actin